MERRAHELSHLSQRRSFSGSVPLRQRLQRARFTALDHAIELYSVKSSRCSCAVLVAPRTAARHIAVGDASPAVSLKKNSSAAAGGAAFAPPALLRSFRNLVGGGYRPFLLGGTSGAPNAVNSYALAREHSLEVREQAAGARRR